MIKEMPASAARSLSVGEWLLYRNQYDQTFNGKLVRKYLSPEGQLFLMVKREEWPREECLPWSEFESGNYVLLD